jgi:hypothetical protein
MMDSHLGEDTRLELVGVGVVVPLVVEPEELKDGQGLRVQHLSESKHKATQSKHTVKHSSAKAKTEQN